MERINPRRFKIPGRRLIPFGDFIITLRALSQFELDESIIAAIDRIASFTDLLTENIIWIETQVQLLARATDSSASLFRESFTVKELDGLYNKWRELQNKSIPENVEELFVELKKQMVSNDEIIMDGFRAKHSHSICDFYGKSVDKLTDGQIIYFQCLISAYEEIRGHVPDGTTKFVSKKWLNGNLNKNLRN